MIVKRVILKGFNAKRDGDIKPTKISNELKINSVEKSDEDVLVKSTLSVKYEDVANLSLEYDIVCDVEDVDAFIKNYKEKKSLNKDDFRDLLNIVLKNGLLEAFVLGKELRLYPPFNLPNVKV